jgi:hypothetical protein
MYSHAGTDDKSVALSVLKEYEMEFSPFKTKDKAKLTELCPLSIALD